jgi:alpha-tubulin suppressor-like RCC1 family protein
MATVTLGKVKFEFRGKYSAGTTYYKDDIVVYDHMKFIYVNASSGSGNAPLILDTTHGWDYAFPNVNPDNEDSLKKWSLNKTYWEYFEDDNNFGEYLGAWNASTNYEIGDVVTGSYGACYYAVKKSINDLPEINIHGSWQLLIEGGKVNHDRKISRRGPMQNPVGWRGNPQFRNITEWTAVGGSAWNGNIPWNITDAETDERWIGDTYHSGSGLRGIAWDGTLVFTSAGSNYEGPDMYSDSTPGATIFPVEHPHFYYQYWTAGMLNNAWSGGQIQKLGADGVERGQLDYYTSTAIDDAPSEPFASSYPRVIQILGMGYGGVSVLYDDGSVQYNGVASYNSLQYDDNIYSTQGYTLNRKHFGGKRIVKIANAYEYGGVSSNAGRFFYLDEDGDLWVQGYNNNGQLGLGPEYDELNGETAWSVGNRIDGVVDAGGFGSDMTSYNEDIPINISLGGAYFDGNKLVDIWCNGGNYATTFVLDEAGRLWSWGYNASGTLGHRSDTGATTTAWIRAPREVGGPNQALDWADYNGIQKFWLAGYDQYLTCYLLDGDGYLWSWGYTGGNRTGDAQTYDNTHVLTAATGRRTSWTNLSDGTIKNFWLTNFQGTANANVWLKKTDNTLWAFGDNSEYQLLDGTTTDSYEPVSVDTGLSGQVYKITGGGVDGTTRFNIFCLTSTNEVFTIPMAQSPIGFGVGASDNNNNYHPQQLSGEAQHGWKRVGMPRGAWDGTIVDINAHAMMYYGGASNYSNYHVNLYLEDGRMYSMWTGSGAGTFGGTYQFSVDTGFTNLLWHGG